MIKKDGDLKSMKKFGNGRGRSMGKAIARECRQDAGRWDLCGVNGTLYL